DSIIKLAVRYTSESVAAATWWDGPSSGSLESGTRLGDSSDGGNTIEFFLREMFSKRFNCSVAPGHGSKSDVFLTRRLQIGDLIADIDCFATWNAGLFEHLPYSG